MRSVHETASTQLQEKPARVPAQKFERLQQRIRQIWESLFPGR
jgi:hypothetical protein